MIQIHHLNNSRSQRILWLLEELSLEYELVKYERDKTTNLAPETLRDAHPLGKSPVMVDGEITIAESGAIIDYIVATYGGGRLAPADIAAEQNKYNEWLHYSEGSAMLPLMLHLYVARLGDAGAPLRDRIDGEIANNLKYMEDALQGRDFFMGNDLTGCDIQLSFVVEAANAFGQLGKYENLQAFLERIQSRPAYRAAIERGGTYGF